MIGIIAQATFREAVRGKTFVLLLLIYVALVLLSRIVGWISGTDGDIVTANMVFSLQSIIGVLVAVATGSMLVDVEVRQRTLYTVLSRPMPRYAFVLGKFLGLCGALIVGQLAMLAIGLIYLALTGLPITGYLVLGGMMTMMEVCLMAAISLTWTSLSSPLLSAVLSLVTYVLGHAVDSLPGLMWHLSNDATGEVWTAQAYITVGLAVLVPNLGTFTYRNEAVHGVPPTAELSYMGVVYGLVWIALLVFITNLVFKRKQL